MKRIILLSFITMCLAGCGTRTFTNTDRAAIEQLLLSGAVDDALKKLDIPQVAGKSTYLDFSNLKCYDVEYVQAAVRARFAEIGALLAEDANGAEFVAEVSSGSMGTEYKSFIIGIPAIPMPGSPTPLPELALARKIEQTGIAKLLIFLHSKGKFTSADHYYGKIERDEAFILWFRSQPTDEIRKRWEAADEKLKARATQKTD